MRLLLTSISYLLTPMAKRFVAGERAEDAILAARRANEKGITAILDFLGEDVSSAEDARAAADEYVHLLQLISDNKVRAQVSLKVSQMGILVSREQCLENLRRVVTEAARLGLFVWIDMEGSALTQKTIDIFSQLRRDFAGLGLCLQAALVRTGSDIDHLARSTGAPGKPLSVRLCKGAYKEPSQIAYTAKSAVENHYRMLVQKLFKQIGTYPAFATHDPALIDYIKNLARERTIVADQFEFQMLYGIQNQRLAGLVQEGYRGTVYIPYGSHWLPYFTRRLRERKENLYFLLRNIFHS